MKLQYRRYDPLRPAIPQIKWWVVGSIVLLIGAWQMAVHRWLMDLPMITGHQVSALLGSAIVVLAVLAFLALIQRYEDRLATGSQIVWELDQSMRQQAAERNTRLAAAAGEIEQLLSEIRHQYDGIPQGTGVSASDTALAGLKGRTDAMERVVCEMYRVIEEGDALQNLLPELLEKHRCLCRTDPEISPQPAGERDDRICGNAATLE